jgi:uncharacterized RDD family membrane protein YckC
MRLLCPRPGRGLFRRAIEEPILPDLPQRPGPRTNDPGAAPTRGRRELMILVILLACGLFVVPLIIWAIGTGMLGPYANGGPFTLLMDFLKGLREGSLVYWSVVIGPYVFVMLLRLVWHFVREADHASD